MLRVRIEELTAQLGEFDVESENLRVIRKALLALPAPCPPTSQTVPRHPTTPPTSYQQILAAFTATGQLMRARDLCQALDLPIVPKNTEGIRSRLNRLVTRCTLTEPEPGLFARPGT
ncbi:hypothetical protein [Streptomyces sp. KL118A]|uniref:hypothetical protein n=1 Tax=Streptomyces sp. KL118A TaxID=3045153 RepID=UPI00278BB2B4|nr:hypothetical protein [Streptomyces sp. KL118A]